MPERRGVSRLFPFTRVEREMADDRMRAAVEAVCARHPELEGRRIDWLAQRLAGDQRGRYHALGYLADPEQGLDPGRAFVVDVVSGHVIRELPLERSRDLPADLGALG